MAETLEFNDVYQEVKGSMVRRRRQKRGGAHVNLWLACVQ